MEMAAEGARTLPASICSLCCADGSYRPGQFLSRAPGLSEVETRACLDRDSESGRYHGPSNILLEAKPNVPGRQLLSLSLYQRRAVRVAGVDDVRHVMYGVIVRGKYVGHAASSEPQRPASH